MPKNLTTLAAACPKTLNFFTLWYLTGKYKIVLLSSTIQVKDHITYFLLSSQWWPWLNIGWDSWKYFAAPLCWSSDAKDCESYYSLYIYIFILLGGVWGGRGMEFEPHTIHTRCVGWYHHTTWGLSFSCLVQITWPG